MNKNNQNAIINAISDLQARGFILDFSIIRSNLFCAQEQCYLDLEEFDVLEMYRFHLGGRPRNLTNVYAIESRTRPLKGILLITETLVRGRYQLLNESLDTQLRSAVSHGMHLGMTNY
jgi:hypothetical protein